jgi:MSHA biogenesis protein MshN
MSVINRMLADLDARRAPPAQAPAGLAVPPVPRGLATRRVQVMALAGTGLAAVLALGDWPAWLGRESHLPQPVQLAGGLQEQAGPMDAPRLLTTALNVPAAAGAMPAVQGSARVGGLSYTLSRPAAAAPARPRVAALSRPRPLPADAPALVVEEPAPAVSTLPAATAVNKQMVAPSAAQLTALAYRQAGELASTGLSSQAIDKAREALRSDPDHGAARQLAAVLLFEKHRLDEARQLLAEGLARPQPDPQLHYLMARLMVEAGDRAGALQMLEHLAAPGADAHGLRAGILAQLGRYREAQPSYEAAVRLDPDNAQWWLGLGVALDAQQQPADARRAFQRARALGLLQGDLLAYVDQKLAGAR